jgi:phosphoadenosine phosphosulfate reductase
MTNLIPVVEKPGEKTLTEINAKLAGWGPQQILAWAIQQFNPNLTLACSFGGISGMVLLDMAVRIDPAIRVFYLDTGFLFPETYALEKEIEQRYGIKPQAFRPELTPEEQANRFGPELWRRNPDRCCALRKLEPNRRALEGMQAWIAGLRRDQSSTRREIQPVQWDHKFNLYKINPLWDWTEEMVWIYLKAEGVPYNRLHREGFPSLGCTNCTRPVATGEDLRAGRWSGLTKTECGLHY